MDDLRWILLLVGAAVVAAIYLSGRFENEDWVRERKQFAKHNDGKAGKKTRKPLSRKSATAAVARVREEPRMVSTEPEVAVKIETDVAVVEPSKKVSPTVTNVNATSDDALAAVTEDSPQNETGIGEVNNTGDIRPDTKEINPGIEDEITEVEIPAELAAAEAEIKIGGTVEDRESPQSQIPVDIEPLVLSLSVLAGEDEYFSGTEVKEALEAEGIKYGAMQIFHFHDPAKTGAAEEGDAVFSVANVLEPGIFELDKMGEMQTPGVMLFCQLPGPLAGERVLELMLDKGRGIAVRLHGHMCDDKRNPFTSQTKTYYQDRITAFNRELALARSKAPAG